MKNVNLGLFFLGKDEADNLLEAEESGEEDGTTIDDKGHCKSNQPIDIQLFDKECHKGDGGHEKDDMEPIATSYVELEDAFGKEVLKEGRDGLHAEAGAGGADRVESWDDDEVEQDVDDHACSSHQVELFQTTIGGKQGAEDVGRRQAEETAHQQWEHVGILPDA